jgi:hypothetical protein
MEENKIKCEGIQKKEKKKKVSKAEKNKKTSKIEGGKTKNQGKKTQLVGKEEENKMGGFH